MEVIKKKQLANLVDVAIITSYYYNMEMDIDERMDLIRANVAKVILEKDYRVI